MRLLLLISSFIVAMPSTSAAQDGPLTLTLAATEQQLIVGQPTKVVLTWSATAPLEVVPSAVFLELKHLDGWQRWREATFASGGNLGLPVLLEPQRPFKSAHVLSSTMTADSNGRRLAVPFEAVGLYSVRAAYRLGDNRIESNPVTVDVVGPAGSDIAVVDAFTDRPDLLGDWSHAETIDAVQDFILSLPADAAHAELAQVLTWKRRIARAEGAMSMAAGSTPSDELKGILGEMRSRSRDQGSFDDDRLWLLASTLMRWNEKQQALPVLKELLASYPDRPNADLARALLAQAFDTAPPVLTVSITPAALWPPNGSLIRVTAVVVALDDTDPHPVVQLQSIVCDDGCEATSDVQDATFGTDDRSFELRAFRRGSSKGGRTYTVTYAAQDASGHSSTATDVVHVPHSQTSTLGKQARQTQ
jgi:hypothetical protein